MHVNYFELNHKDYLIMLNRLTGFARCEATVNKGTDEAILAIKNWGDQYGYPYKIISDWGPAFREDFKKQLITYNIEHKPSSAYHPESNSLAKRGVSSVKDGIKKSAVRITKQHLNELTFAINMTTSSEGTGNPAERFFGRSVRSRLPNSIDPGVKSSELIKRRIIKHDARIKSKNKTNKIRYSKVNQITIPSLMKIG